MPLLLHHIILYGLVTLGVIASTLWLLWQWRDENAERLGSMPEDWPRKWR